MPAKSFWDHPIEKLEEALHLKKQIHALQSKLNGMFDSGKEEDSGKAGKKNRGGRATSSAASPQKIGAAQRARKSVSPTGFARPGAKSKVRRKGGMSPEGRERIAAAQRARWAKAKGGSSAPARATKPAASSKPAKNVRVGTRTHSPEVRARLAAAMKARWAAAKRKGLPAPNARR
jgi:hypothetical protein